LENFGFGLCKIFGHNVAFDNHGFKLFCPDVCVFLFFGLMEFPDNFDFRASQFFHDGSVEKDGFFLIWHVGKVGIKGSLKDSIENLTEFLWVMFFTVDDITHWLDVLIFG
jgi:hypothetical protein